MPSFSQLPILSVIETKLQLSSGFICLPSFYYPYVLACLFRRCNHYLSSDRKEVLVHSSFFCHFLHRCIYLSMCQFAFALCRACLCVCFLFGLSILHSVPLPAFPLYLFLITNTWHNTHGLSNRGICHRALQYDQKWRTWFCLIFTQVCRHISSKGSPLYRDIYLADRGPTSAFN